MSEDVGGLGRSEERTELNAVSGRCNYAISIGLFHGAATFALREAVFQKGVGGEGGAGKGEAGHVGGGLGLESGKPWKSEK